MMFLIVLVGVAGTVVKGDVATCSAYKQNVAKCQTDFPINNTLTDFQKFYKLPNEQICADNFQDHLGCVAESYAHCEIDNPKILVTSGDSYEKAVDKICENREDYKGACISVAFGTCVTNGIAAIEAPTNTSTDVERKEHQCKVFDVPISCTEVSTDLIGCDKPKTKVILKEVLTELKPEDCTNTNTNGATTFIMTTSLLLVSLISSLFL